MANNYFKFKQFTINQQNAAMKVGTDGVLLGAWADCKHAKQILDIGSGTGLIAIMLAQRSNAFIDAVEIDALAYSDAKLNIKNCPWKDEIRIFNSAIQGFNPQKTYDLVVSNPPYFSKSLKANTEERTKARHDDGLSTQDLFYSASRLMNCNGKFSVVIPSDNQDQYLAFAIENKLFCSKKLWLKPTPSKENKRVLLEFKFSESPCHEQQMIIEDKGRHQYSDDYIALTKDFYLNF